MTVQQEQITQELQINPALINEQLETQAARYAYWGSLASEATRNARNAKLHAQMVDAEVYSELKANLVVEGHSISRAAEDAKRLRDSDPRRVAAWQQYNDLQYQADVLDVGRMGFLQRKDCLVTIAANLRGEMGGQVRLRQSPAPTNNMVGSVPPTSPTNMSQQPGTTTSRLQVLQSQYLQQTGEELG